MFPNLLFTTSNSNKSVLHPDDFTNLKNTIGLNSDREKEGSVIGEER